jgi:hypothetical protein
MGHHAADGMDEALDRAYLGGDRGPVATLQPEHPARLIRRGDFQ